MAEFIKTEMLPQAYRAEELNVDADLLFSVADGVPVTASELSPFVADLKYYPGIKAQISESARYIKNLDLGTHSMHAMRGFFLGNQTLFTLLRITAAHRNLGLSDPSLILSAPVDNNEELGSESSVIDITPYGKVLPKYYRDWFIASKIMLGNITNKDFAEIDKCLFTALEDRELRELTAEEVLMSYYIGGVSETVLLFEHQAQLEWEKTL